MRADVPPDEDQRLEETDLEDLPAAGTSDGGDGAGQAPPATDPPTESQRLAVNAHEAPSEAGATIGVWAANDCNELPGPPSMDNELKSREPPPLNGGSIGHAKRRKYCTSAGTEAQRMGSKTEARDHKYTAREKSQRKEQRRKASWWICCRASQHHAAVSYPSKGRRSRAYPTAT